MKSYMKDYPRPQLARKQWMNLNGTWNFAFDDKDKGEDGKWFQNFPKEHKKIEVPYTYETLLSKIHDEKHHNNVWYERELHVDKRNDNRVMLHFEGSDFYTKVWINGEYVGSHTGGYARFSFDVTKYVVDGKNSVSVKVEDSKSMEQPRGKQRWMPENFSCWYVQSTGIWKTVWMEYVPSTYLSEMKLTPNLQKQALEIEGLICEEQDKEEYYLETTISYQDHLINQSRKKIQRGMFKDVISVFNPEESEWGVHKWAPEHPELYDVSFAILSKDGKVIDEALSYFGLREIRIEDGNILLNGSPLYQRLILDQGYWKDSHLTPPDEEALIADIDKIHELGYNGLRKHMKIEDERFLYWCDVKGMLVWSEMAATYDFTDKAIQEFTTEWMEIVKQNYNHPCIITWTPFNESWGVPQIKTDVKQQNFTEGIFHLTKSFDSMRPVICNDGWEHTVSDIITLHDYEEDGEVFLNRYEGHLEELMTNQIYHSTWKSAMANGYAYKGQPIIISEYGGLAFSGGEEGSWGYGNVVTTEEDFLKRFDKITSAIKKVPYIVGFCYTQVSDVQQEINGLMDIERNFKIAPEKIAEINKREVGIHRIVSEN